MPAAPQNLMNAGHFYSNIAKPIDINLNFIVDSTNGNGLGVRSVKSNGYVKNVFMTTSAPLAGSGNPNPLAGYAVIKLQGNFNKYIGGFAGVQAPLGSTGTTSLTATHPYVITSLGTTTLAQWQTAGLTAGITPAVGVAFISTTGGAIGGTGTVGIPAASTTLSIQVVGDPSLSMANSNTSANGGGQIIVSFIGDADSLVTPADNSVVAMTIRLDGSSVTVDGI